MPKHNDLGLIHAYTGDGKGKTTAAVGLSVRAASGGLRVAFFQFLKGRPSAELSGLATLGVEVVRVENPESILKFTFQMTAEELEECRRQHQDLLAKAIGYAVTGDYDLLVLDELFGAVSTGMVEPGDITLLIQSKSSATELVMTGRDLPDAVRPHCHYISEISAIRHPYEDGVPARKGIEF